MYNNNGSIRETDIGSTSVATNVGPEHESRPVGLLN